jgi:hypothetical protein
VPSMRIASPERVWRAAAAPALATLIGWVVADSVRLGFRPGASPGLPLTSRIIVTGLAAAAGLCLAVLIMRTHLSVTNEEIADHRVFRVVRVPLQMITDFEVARPGGVWGGFCVTAICRDGTTIDLMSTRAYSRLPSANHLDELTRICWTLEDAVMKRPG